MRRNDVAIYNYYYFYAIFMSILETARVFKLALYRRPSQCFDFHQIKYPGRFGKGLRMGLTSSGSLSCLGLGSLANTAVTRRRMSAEVRIVNIATGRFGSRPLMKDKCSDCLRQARQGVKSHAEEPCIQMNTLARFCVRGKCGSRNRMKRYEWAGYGVALRSI